MPLMAVLWCCVALALVGCACSLQCVGQDGRQVEWWVVLKYPGGFGSTYVDSNSVAACQTAGSCWSSTFDVRSNNAVVNTVRLAQQPGVAFLFYNDEDPDSGREMWTNAHAKGVVLFDTQSGVWIVHSAPKYPDRTNASDWWVLRRPQSMFGQHFACVSLTQASTDALGRILALANVYMYDKADLAPELAQLYPTLARFMGSASNRRFSANGSKLQQALETVAGTSLTAFTKAPSPGKPLHMHEEIVEAAFQVPMLWETWRPGGEPSFCPSQGVPSFNSKSIRVPETCAEWLTKDDHSKWGVSVNATTPAACFGDLNRAESQARRGGSYLCWTEPSLWSTVHKLVVEYEQCQTQDGQAAQ